MPINKEQVKSQLRAAGVYKSGVSQIGLVADTEMARYDRWILQEMNAGMEYMANHREIRRDPSLLLPGAKTLISCAFNYYYPIKWKPGLPKWARYALGTDYHEVVRERLTRVAGWITSETGEQCRVCVDTAPLNERYWAVQSGVGFIGSNNQLIIPGAGSYFFLGEILTTLPLDAEDPCAEDCNGCGKCVRACPGGALGSLNERNIETHSNDFFAPIDGIETIGGDSDDGRELPVVNCRRCLSYLTIEHRGEFPQRVRLGSHIYGCDVCQDVCPHNSNPPVTEIPEFIPRSEILDLSSEDIASMTQSEFSVIFKHSAVKRAKLAGLQRNNKSLDLSQHLPCTQLCT
ncbi:MAG: DUF1730 domain-containing protein [Duncaniella sp.]|nr:DUF1730 domain-containing protein [Duncaniella sp.]